MVKDGYFRKFEVVVAKRFRRWEALILSESHNEKVQARDYVALDDEIEI
jgi:hypothetical protein